MHTHPLECRCGKEFRPLGPNTPNILRCLVCGALLAVLPVKAAA